MVRELRREDGGRLILPFLLGTRPDGEPVTVDLAALPHLLVAGTTGSGKSVFLNSMLVDLMRSGVNARYMLFDPKRVEFAAYRQVISTVYVDEYDMRKALDWLVRLMDDRFSLLERQGVRDIDAYNAKQPADDHMPRYVVVVDELANLMLGRNREWIEAPLTRLAQMSRAIGIHLVLATQRPTVDVVTGLLKANIPARVSFAVVTRIDSGVILDAPGGETLHGKGDMLARIPGTPGLARLQAPYVSVEEWIKEGAGT